MNNTYTYTNDESWWEQVSTVGLKLVGDKHERVEEQGQAVEVINKNNHYIIKKVKKIPPDLTDPSSSSGTSQHAQEIPVPVSTPSLVQICMDPAKPTPTKLSPGDLNFIQCNDKCTEIPNIYNDMNIINTGTHVVSTCTPAAKRPLFVQTSDQVNVCTQANEFENFESNSSSLMDTNLLDGIEIINQDADTSMPVLESTVHGAPCNSDVNPDQVDIKHADAINEGIPLTDLHEVEYLPTTATCSSSNNPCSMPSVSTISQHTQIKNTSLVEHQAPETVFPEANEQIKSVIPTKVVKNEVSSVGPVSKNHLRTKKTLTPALQGILSRVAEKRKIKNENNDTAIKTTVTDTKKIKKTKNRRNICFVCRKKYISSDADQNPWVGCDNEQKCRSWAHYQCVGWGNHIGKNVEHLSYRCPDCEQEATSKE